MRCTRPEITRSGPGPTLPTSAPVLLTCTRIDRLRGAAMLSTVSDKLNWIPDGVADTEKIWETGL